MNVRETRPDVSADAQNEDAHAPRPLTLTENIVLTLKVLGGMVLMGSALWAANFWLAAK